MILQVRSRVEKADAELRKLEKESEAEIQAHGQVGICEYYVY